MIVRSKSSTDTARVSAAIHLLDRGWGKAVQPIEGRTDNDIQITIRKVMEIENGKLIEGEVVEEKQPRFGSRRTKSNGSSEP